MSIKNSDRQYPLAAMVRFAFGDLTSGTEIAAVEVPDGAVVTGGQLVIETVFDSGTSDTITIGDATDEDRYAAGIDGTAAASTALVPTGYQYVSGGDVTLTWTGAGTAPTQGSGYLVVEYIREGRSFENQG